MRLVSHIVIARYVADAFSITGAERKAFIAGSVEPDCVMLTYFRGLGKGRGINGHSWENISPFLPDLIGKVSSSGTPVLMFFHLGRLCHYLVDSFTYPHNSCFKGTLAEHMAYEHSLHRFLTASCASSPFPYACGNDFSTAWLMSRHGEYLSGVHSAMHDIRYSLSVIASALRALVSEPWAAGTIALKAGAAVEG